MGAHNSGNTGRDKTANHKRDGGRLATRGLPRLAGLIVAATLMAANPVAERVKAADPSAPDADGLGRLLLEAAVPGVAAAWLEDCRPTRVETAGVADTGTGAPVTALTAFEAASLSKPVFAYLSMQLADRGALDLDAAIAGHLDYPRITDTARYAHLTARMVLSHRSGLPNWAGRGSDAGRRDPLPFLFQPGTGFSYSGEGYQLLQARVAQVTGQPLETLFRQSLGDIMPRSTYVVPLARDVRRSYGHDANGGKAQGRAMRSPRTANAAFTLRTVAADYARFVATVCDGTGLSAAAHADMLRPVGPVRADVFGADPAAIAPAEIFWTPGWGLQRLNGRDVYFHWGDNGVFKAFAAFDPVARTGAVYFANGKGGLKLAEPLIAPAVGTIQPVLTWLN
ncbi:serine hydrolase domain-containing protein [Eilatimonas milleporae]|uniref:CubicO group peptidase (Beta-lactamase class C family) n=1 Tax=Eilatimonas milleporae TaxID=911205 RepID=A0A3M0CFQ8_9PROT|nr:serine hydrolase domain-containing protein [Eilatimonas milleporae]RMB08438.1 CubicO group peptidase (beta-lactamase class C family) [Eilatimonas milleporae]